MTGRTRVLVGALLLGTCAWVAACDGQAPRPEARSGPKLKVSAAGKVLIEARAQRPDGSRVVVDAVEFDAAGYVVVHEDAGGAPGRVVGSSRLLEAGRHRDVTVKIGDASRASSAVWVMLHREDGEVDEGTFDFPDGDPPVGADNGVAVVRVELISDEGEGRG